jgi:hypothetical protein
VFLYTIAQAHRLSGDCQTAIAKYKAFIATTPAQSQVEAAQENIRVCEAELAARPPPPPPPERPIVPPAPVPWYRDWVGNTLVLSGVAALGGGLIIWELGHQTIDDINQSPDYYTFRTRQSSEHRAHLEQVGGVAAVATGGALIGLGLVRYFWHRDSRADSLAIDAATVPGGAKLVWSGHF